MLALSAISVAAMNAAASAATVQDIVKRGNVTIGVLVGSPPIGFQDENGNLAGYDVDVANYLGKLLGVTVNLVPVTSPNRVAELVAGKVDFMVATLNPLPDRAMSVAFTIPYEGFKAVMVEKATDNYKTYDDLKGKKIGLTRGSNNEGILGKYVDKVGFQMVRFDDDSTVLQALATGQIDAAAEPDATIYPLLKSRPDMGLKVAFDMALSANSIAVRLDDTNLLQWLNTAINFMKQSGDLNAISQKWIGVDVPPLPTF